MARTPERLDITKRRIVYEIVGMRDVPVERGLIYQEAPDALTMDVYYPRNGVEGTETPAVVFVNGYSDIGARTVLGCALKEMESFVSWGQLLAASGLAAVVYETGRDPAADAESAIDYLLTNAASLGIDNRRIGLWACSGHVPNALSLLMNGRGVVKCAALCYGLMLDLHGSTAVADASTQYRFVNPGAGRTVVDIPADAALLVVRAGRDEFSGLNETIDRFVTDALAANLPLTVVNHPQAPHAFDLMDDSELSREIIRQAVGFLSFHLRR
jgi:hypothetical protein